MDKESEMTVHTLDFRGRIESSGGSMSHEPFIEALASRGEGDKVLIRIDSTGGHTSYAKAIKNAIILATGIGVDVRALVVGHCSSAAFNVLLGVPAASRFAMSDARMCVHWGTALFSNDEFSELHKLLNAINKGKMPKADDIRRLTTRFAMLESDITLLEEQTYLTRKEARRLLCQNRMMEAKEMLERGFVCEVVHSLDDVVRISNW